MYNKGFGTQKCHMTFGSTDIANWAHRREVTFSKLVSLDQLLQDTEFEPSGLLSVFFFMSGFTFISISLFSYERKIAEGFPSPR